jgi:hypothetical protein
VPKRQGKLLLSTLIVLAIALISSRVNATLSGGLVTLGSSCRDRDSRDVSQKEIAKLA